MKKLLSLVSSLLITCPIYANNCNNSGTFISNTTNLTWYLTQEDMFNGHFEHLPIFILPHSIAIIETHHTLLGKMVYDVNYTASDKVSAFSINVTQNYCLFKSGLFNASVWTDNDYYVHYKTKYVHQGNYKTHSPATAAFAIYPLVRTKN